MVTANGEDGANFAIDPSKWKAKASFAKNLELLAE